MIRHFAGSKMCNQAVKARHTQRCPALQLHSQETSVPHCARCSCPKGKAHALSTHECAGRSVLFTELICARDAYSTPCILRKILLLDKFFTLGRPARATAIERRLMRHFGGLKISNEALKACHGCTFMRLPCPTVQGARVRRAGLTHSAYMDWG